MMENQVTGQVKNKVESQEMNAKQNQKKPDWLRVKAPTSKAFNETRELVREKGLHTVCEEAACPNIGECWQKKHVTVMILGDTCTRACAFCNVKTGRPLPINETAEIPPPKTSINLPNLRNQAIKLPLKQQQQQQRKLE